MENDSVFKKNRERWHETLQKDIYMEEALNVLTDLTLNPKGDGFTALKE
jgi:carboxyl-terminal processing protease